MIAEEREYGILLRPAVALPLEVYTPTRRAEFLLSTPVNASDYEATVRGQHLMQQRLQKQQLEKLLTDLRAKAKMK